METSQYIGLFFTTLLVLSPLLAIAVLAFTVSIVALVSLYRFLSGYVADERDLWLERRYTEHRVEDVVQKAKDKARAAHA